MSALLKGRRWVPALRVAIVALLAQPAVAALLKSTSERYPAVAAIVAAVEGLVAAAAAMLASEPSEPAPEPGGDGGR